MIKAKYITEIDGKKITEVEISGNAETLMTEFSAIIKSICEHPDLLEEAYKTVDDMIANIDDDIKQLLKENEDND